MSEINERSLHDAAKAYQDIGFYIHPLRPRDKIPTMNKWSEIGQHFTESELKKHFENKDPKNIGLVCGKVSDCTVIDRDFIVKGLWEGLESTRWVRQQRTDSRDHLFFRYCPDLQAKKYHALGFEILNNGNNCVLTPSRHPSGDVYQFTQGEPENRPQMNKKLIDRIKDTITTFEDLQRSVNNCRPVFRKFFKAHFTDNQKSNPHYRDVSIFHGASGRELTLYFFAELKANGATFDELVLLCKLIFLDEYDSADSEYQIGKIAAKATARKETIKAHSVLSQFYDASEDVTTGRQEQKSSLPTHFVTNEEPAIEEATEEIKTRARKITEHGNPLKYITEEHQRGHIGDIPTAQVILLSTCCSQVLNSDGIQPKLSGESGKGKTDCARKMLHLFPQEYVKITSASDKALFYSGAALKPGSSILLDDVILSDDFEKTINRATSAFQEGVEHTTLDINRKLVSHRLPERLVWLITSVNNDQSLQFLNRTVGGEVDESTEQDERVRDMQLEKAVSGAVGLPITDNVLICREIIREIKKNTYLVRIPFAKAILWNDTSNRRNLPIFLDLIKSFAVLRHMQRDIDSDGALLASLQDFVDAQILYESFQKIQATKLTQAERNVICVLMDNKAPMTAREICAKLGFGRGRLSQILHGKGHNHDSGLFFKVPSLWSEDITEISSERYVRTKQYGVDSAFVLNDRKINLDTTIYPDLSLFTSSLPYEIKNSSIVFTLFTLNKNIEEKKEAPHPLCEDISETHPSTYTPEKQGKKVNTSQKIAKNGVNAEGDCLPSSQQLAKSEGKHQKKEEKTESCGLTQTVSDIEDSLDQWEKSNGPIYGKRAIQAAQEISKAHKIHPTEYAFVEAAVKKRAAGRCVDCGSNNARHEETGKGYRCDACHKIYSNPPPVKIPEEFSLEGPAEVTP